MYQKEKAVNLMTGNEDMKYTKKDLKGRQNRAAWIFKTVLRKEMAMRTKTAGRKIELAFLWAHNVLCTPACSYIPGWQSVIRNTQKSNIYCDGSYSTV